MTGPVALSPLDLGLSAGMLLLFGAVSVGFRLGLGRLLAIAGLRATVQLGILGLVLVPVFAVQSPWPVVAWCALMILLAGREAVARTRHRVDHPRFGRGGMLGTTVLAMALGGGGSALFATVAVLDVETWWTPRYLVPLVGMILGNALSGVSLGIDAALGALVSERQRVEALLALGATRTEATRSVARDAIRTGLVPILNSMSAVGLVSIPGMMTGQILGGTPPFQAAQYQLLILFLIAGAVAVGTLVAVGLTLRLAIDDAHRLRIDRIRRVER